MEISVFGNYKIKHNCKYSYLNEDEEFVDQELNEEFVADGCKVIAILKRCLENNELTEFRVKENTIITEEFNPMTGESSLSVLEITEEPVNDKGEQNE